MGAIAPLLSIGFQAFGAVAQYSAQQDAADAEAERQRQYAIQRNEALRLQQNSLRNKQAQEDEEQARKRFQTGLEERKAAGKARAAAASAGISGVSVDDLLRDFSFQTTFFTESSKRQEEFISQQTNIQAQANAQQASFDIFANSPPIEQPSFAGAALRIGQAALGLFKG